jgi:hypothetical protein
MLPGIPHRQHASRLPMLSLTVPGMLHRNGHDHHTRTVALASWSAGLVIGTAAGAILFGRHSEAAGDASVAETSGE